MTTLTLKDFETAYRILPSYAGLEIVESIHVTAEAQRLFPFSRHRSARIRKKLIKRFGGEFRREPAAYQCGTTLYVHPTIAIRIRQKIAERLERHIDNQIWTSFK